jgi:hypothetical protein
MSRLETANLIRVFDFYLACMALFSFLRRYNLYRNTLLLLLAGRGRWPRLTDRIRRHRELLLNWPTARPLVLALILLTAQWTASRLVFPSATLRVADLYDPRWQLVVMLFAALPMLLIDGYFILRVGRFDRAETEKYLDMAESWAGTWKARMVRVATFGRINPDRMVDEELKKGLTWLGLTMNWSMRWVAAQAAARLFCGLVIWLLWAVR